MRPEPDWRLDGETSGLRAFFANFSGNRRSRWERRGAVLASAAAPALAIAAIVAAGADLAAWQIALLMVLAVDLGGGVFVNASAAAKRWYHRAGARDWHHAAFVAAHLHPFAVAWALPGVDWAWAAALYGGTMLAALAVLACPPYLRRPVALTLAALVLAVLPLAAPAPVLIVWFAPFFVLKLLVAHILHEEPYAA